MSAAQPGTVPPAGSWLNRMLAQTTVKFVHDTTPLPHGSELQEEAYQRSTVHFNSQGQDCEAWLYMPTSKAGIPEMGRPPVVILGHGLGSQKDMGLHGFAEKFVHAGMAVFVFDYRFFGGSSGYPRHKLRWQSYLEDWESALDFVTDPVGVMSKKVDSNRMALWGGGHVLMMAARHPDLVSAVVSNEPYLSARGQLMRAVRERGLGKVALMLSTAVVDKVRQSIGLSPLYVKMIGGKDELSLLQMGEEELSWIERPQPRRQGGWQNLGTASMLLSAWRYNPVNHLTRIQCPVLLIAGTKDSVCLIESVRNAAQVLGPKATLLERPHGHFELHKKGADPELIKPVVQFLCKHLEP